MRIITRHLKILGISTAILAGVILALPFALTQYINLKNKPTKSSFEDQFPITVDPINKTITEDAEVEAYLEREDYNTQAALLLSTNKLEDLFLRLALSISQMTDNYNLALIGGERFVQIPAGLRREEVTDLFARKLRWNEKEKKEFMSPQEGQSLPLIEGSFFPGIYAIKYEAKPRDAQNLVNERFTNNVLSRYATSTDKIVPLNVALTLASLIQRETIGTDDMRIISGIIWNRIFAGMNLQLDATLQYTKSSKRKTSPWWPEVRPQDKFIKSPYNTYLHNGLPPNPIASPSVAAIIAALNPLKTACLFYFHDEKGDLHCTSTYKEHVALLKKFYGRGK